jgi:hypothetical protein
LIFVSNSLSLWERARVRAKQTQTTLTFIPPKEGEEVVSEREEG